MAIKKNIQEEEEELSAAERAAGELEAQKAQKPGSYQSKYQGQLEGLAGQILNRKEFSYDPSSDSLYQQMVDQYVSQGALAMADTIGRAQTMTGGYGNSYAQTAGQQAYQGYLQQAADRLPEYYQLARDQYDRQGQQLADRYALVQGLESGEYGRYQDAVNQYYSQLDRAQSVYDQERAFQYQQDRDQVADQQWQAELAEEQRQFNYKHGIPVSAAQAQQQKQAQQQAQWWDWWMKGGGTGVSQQRQSQIAGWVESSLASVTSPSFSLDKLISGSSYLKTQQEREYAQAVGKYIAGIK